MSLSLLPGAATWGKWYLPLKWILYYFGSVIATTTMTSWACSLCSHIHNSLSHGTQAIPHLCKVTMWVLEDRLFRMIKNALDNALLFQTLHSSCSLSDITSDITFLWTESISWAFCLLTLSSRLLTIPVPFLRLLWVLLHINYYSRTQTHAQNSFCETDLFYWGCVCSDTNYIDIRRRDES